LIHGFLSPYLQQQQKELAPEKKGLPLELFLVLSTPARLFLANMHSSNGDLKRERHFSCIYIGIKDITTLSNPE
jgi:hypothetical protein